MSNIVCTPLDFCAIFSFVYNVFINIHEYDNLIICISDNQVKVLCLGISLMLTLVFYDELLLRYEYFVGTPHSLIQLFCPHFSSFH